MIYPFEGNYNQFIGLIGSICEVFRIINQSPLWFFLFSFDHRSFHNCDDLFTLPSYMIITYMVPEGRGLSL